MNRLKYVLGIHVPHSVSPNVYRTHHSDARLLKPTKFFSPRTKRLNEFRSLQYAGQQRNGIILPQNCNRPNSNSNSTKKTSPEGNCPVTCVHKDRNATLQLAKASSSKRNAGKSKEKVAESVKDMKNSKLCEMNVIRAMIAKEPRSYAQMIANYSEAMYAQSGIEILKEGANLTKFNGVHRSPFSTASVASLKLKNKDRAPKKANLRATGCGALQQEAKFSSGAFVTRYDCRNDHRNFVQTFGGTTDLERSSSSYATMIEKYSNAMNVSVDSGGCSNNAVPRRNASTKFNDAPMAFLDTKNNDRPSEVTSGNARTASKEVAKEEASDVEKQGQVGWVTKMEDVIKDLKRIAENKDETDVRTNEKLMLQSLNKRAYWLDRVVTAHKRRNKDRNPMSGKTTVGQAKMNESVEVTENVSRKERVMVAPKENPSPITQTKMAINKPKNPIAEYIKTPGSVSSNTPTKSSFQSPTTAATAPVKEPQIELRMTPSQNESVVSINVDEQATKTPGAKDQLSVVISSQRGRSGKVDATNVNTRSDFGSMQISISENTVPVKQLEFSINGKPVSELKSIVARADKLDVVSSMDKVEIRIPSSKDRVSSEHAKHLTKTVSGTTPVLNLQIAAKFNEPRVQQPTNTNVNTTATPTTNPLTPVPPRSKVLFAPKLAKNEASTANVTSVKRTEDAAGTKPVNTVYTFDTRASISKQETAPNVAGSSPSAVTVNDAVFHDVNSNSNVPPTNPARQPSMDIGNTNSNSNKSPETRTPSNMIPWWSSEDSFKKIRKKKNTPKEASPLVEDKITTSKTQETVNEPQTTEQTALSPGTAADQQLSPVDPSKTVSPASPASPEKDEATKKPILDEKQKFGDSTHRVVRVRSPHKRVTVKPISSVKTLKYGKRNSALNISRFGKRIKFRPKSNIVATSAAQKKEPETLTVSTPRSPKVYKYVSVNPRRASTDEKPEVPKASSPSTQMKDEQCVQVSKAEGSKVEQESKPNAKLEKSVVPQRSASQVGKANVQNSKTILNDTGLKKPANRSAGVSAGSSLVSGKGSEQDKADRTIEKEQPKGSETADEVSTQRLKEILKSMKPIEKRKDGTLIDYGVTVPSRKPSGKLRQTPRIQSKTSITIDPKKVIAVPSPKLKDTSRQGKIVEPEKISSVKKETLTEPKHVTTQEKIVDAVKVSSTKKSIEAKSLDTSQETKKLNKPESKVQPEKAVTKEPSMKSLNRGDGKAITFSKSIESKSLDTRQETKKLNKPESKVQPEKAVTKAPSMKSLNPGDGKAITFSKSIESKSLDTSQETKKLNKPESKVQPEKAVTKQPSMKSLNPGDGKAITFSKSIESKSLDTSQETKKLNKPESKVQPEKAVTKAPSMKSLNTGDGKAITFSKSTGSDKIKKNPLEDTITSSRPQFLEKQGPKKNLTLPQAPLKAPLKKTVVRSKSAVDKKVARVDRLPLEGTIVLSPRKSRKNVTGNDDTLLNGPVPPLEKRLDNTGSAPLKGTIDYRPKNQDSLPTVININEKKNSTSDTVRERQDECFPKSNVPKTPSNKGGSSSESSGSVSIPTGPAGLKSARSFTVTKVLSDDKALIPVEHSSQGSQSKISEKGKSEEGTPFNEDTDTCMLFSKTAMRPEKDMLYTSWLQRFKNKLDDDEVV